MRVTLVTALLATLLVAGCGDEAGPRTEPTVDPRPSTSPSSSQSRTTTGVQRLRLEDGGTNVDLRPEGTAVVFLPRDHYEWGDPAVDGDAATISEDVSDSPTSSQSWTITGREQGEATVTIVGSPTCRSATPPCNSPETVWTVRVTVG